uniref:N/A n=1 Tax=Ganoderma boninense TaxID=34458 RepID=A0A5K1K4W5_9APHY|nr:N/A [Ganoderma boninense]
MPHPERVTFFNHVPYASRVHIALEEANPDYTPYTVDPPSKPPWLVSGAHPIGKVSSLGLLLRSTVHCPPVLASSSLVQNNAKLQTISPNQNTGQPDRMVAPAASSSPGTARRRLSISTSDPPSPGSPPPSEPTRPIQRNSSSPPLTPSQRRPPCSSGPGGEEGRMGGMHPSAMRRTRLALPLPTGAAARTSSIARTRGAFRSRVTTQRASSGASESASRSSGRGCSGGGPRP